MTSFWKKKLKIIFFSPPGGARELKLRPFDSESKTTSGCSNCLILKKITPNNLFSFYQWRRYELRNKNLFFRLNFLELLAREIKSKDNERFLSVWFLWNAPHSDKSVQHQDHTFSVPKIRQFNTSNASVQQTRQFSTKNRQFNTEKSVIPTHWRFLWLELTLFCIELTLFCVELRDFGGGKGMAFLCGIFLFWIFLNLFVLNLFL